MKTMKKKLLTIGLSLTVLAGTVSAGTFADKNNTNRTSDYKDYLETYMLEKEIEELVTDEGQVRVMNNKEEMVIQGKITDEEIKKFIRVADLLTEVDGITYYRLSYK